MAGAKPVPNPVQSSEINLSQLEELIRQKIAVCLTTVNSVLDSNDYSGETARAVQEDFRALRDQLKQYREAAEENLLDYVENSAIMLASACCDTYVAAIDIHSAAHILDDKVSADMRHPSLDPDTSYETQKDAVRVSFQAYREVFNK